MQTLLTLFEHHPYSILFTVILLELIAIPISAEFFMSYAGYFIQDGKMHYVLAILVVSFAACTGATITYIIGRFGGTRLIERYGNYVHLSPERYEKASNWMNRSGNKLLIIAYFIPGIRHITGYIAGSSQLSYKKYARTAYFGATLWGITFITIGKWLGPEWQAFHHTISKYIGWGMWGMIAVVILYVLYRILKKS